MIRDGGTAGRGTLQRGCNAEYMRTVSRDSRERGGTGRKEEAP